MKTRGHYICQYTKGRLPSYGGSVSVRKSSFEKFRKKKKITADKSDGNMQRTIGRRRKTMCEIAAE